MTVHSHMRRYRFFSPLLLLVVLLMATSLHGAPGPVRGKQRLTLSPVPGIFATNEVLTYSVSFMKIRVGSILLSNLGPTTIGSQEGYSIACVIESDPSFFFLSIRYSYTVLLNTSCAMLHYRSVKFDSDGTRLITYAVNSRSGAIEVGITNFSPEMKAPTAKTNWLFEPSETLHDNVALLYLARALSGVPLRDYTVAAFENFEEKSCQFTQTGVPTEIDFKGTRIGTYYINGEIDFISIAGIADTYEGWFSADPQRVPLRAHMKAVFGNIVISLESWKNWPGAPQPPIKKAPAKSSGKKK